MPALGIALIVLAFVAPAVASKYMSRRQAALPQHQATIRSATRIPETDDLELVVDIFPVGGMSYELKYTIQDQPYAGYYQYRPGTRVLVRLSPDVLPTIMDMILDPAYEAELRDISTWPRFPAVILETQVVGTIENDAAFHEFRLRIEPHDKAAYETVMGKSMFCEDVADDYGPGTHVIVRVCPHAPQIVEGLTLDRYPQPPKPGV